MILTKKQILETIESIPEERLTHIDVVFEELVLMEKIQRGLDDIKKGNVISEEEMDREVESW